MFTSNNIRCKIKIGRKKEGTVYENYFISMFSWILLGPQVRFQKAAIEKLAAGRKAGPIPVDVIDMRDYGTMNGKAVFETAMKMIG